MMDFVLGTKWTMFSAKMISYLVIVLNFADRTSTSVDETQQDKLPRSQDTANQVDKAKDSSIDHVMSGVTNASKSSFCRKCKDFGHATEYCTVSGTQEFGAESSVIATSSSKEEMHEGNRLKAAIQAALLRRPEIHKRKEAPDQTNEFPTSSTGLKREVTSQKQVLVSSTLKNSISAEESNMKQEIIVNSTVETSKCPSANDLKQVKFCRTDFCSQLRKSDSAGPTSGKPVVRDDFPNNAMEISSILSKMSVIPEYECIWQYVTSYDELVYLLFWIALVVLLFMFCHQVCFMSFVVHAGVSLWCIEMECLLTCILEFKHIYLHVLPLRFMR